MRPVATIVGVPSEDFDIPSEPILTGRLNNSEYLLHLVSQLGYLPKTVQTDLVELFNSHLSLFSDTPSCTNMIEHDIDVGEAKLIKQHFQRMPMGKHKRMEKEVEYMLKNGIAEPACSSWTCWQIKMMVQIDFVQISGRLMRSLNLTVTRCLVWRIVLIKWEVQSL